MSISRPNLWLAAILAVVSLVSSASAQRISPFIEPDYFEPDLQFFAPAEISDFGGGEPPNVGFYFDYDSTYVNVSRPEGEPSFFSPFDGDFGWGNRYELGYMTEDDVGFQAVHWHLNGPGEYLVVDQERIDRLNITDTPQSPEPILADRNPRRYLLMQSINVVNMSSTELNKTFRKKQFDNGAVLEPLVGLRYMTFMDFYRRDTYIRDPDPFLGPVETLTKDKAWFENNMLGGQLGFRLQNNYGHWNLSTEFRMFAMQNFQFLTNQTSIVRTEYLLFPINVTKTKTRVYEDNAEFVWGGELRGEASYELTRDISLRFGFVIMDLGQGIGRGDQINQNNFQDVFIGGATFGLTINR